MEQFDPFLVGLDMCDKPVVVVGGGTVASRKIRALYDSGARVRVISPSITPTISGLVRGRVQHVAREFQSGDTAGAWFVVAATNNPQVNAVVAQEAAEGHIFCNRVDNAAEGSAISPAKARISGALVGILSGDPHRSIELKNIVLQAITHGYSAAETQDIQESQTGSVTLIGAGPGPADLITVRAALALSTATVVVTDRLVSAELLDGLQPQVVVIDAAKNPYGRAMSQDEINQILVEYASQGHRVVRLKGGDPYVFGRGLEEFIFVQSHGIPVSVIPGLTSAFAVPALAGIPVTHRGVNHEVIVVSGHIAPDDPRSLTRWELLAGLQGTLIILMGMAHVAQLIEVLLAGGRDGNTPVAIIENGSLPHERIVTARLDSIVAKARGAHITSPAVIIIGDVVEVLKSSQSPQ